MAFPPGFLDELRSRISLPELIGRRVSLVRRGREYAGLCPFHNERTPSFYVVEDKNFFHCFGCGAHGDAIGFAMRADNIDFVEAIEKLAGEAGLAVPQATPQERERARQHKTLLEATEAAAAFYETRLWSPAGSRAREYLQARGLDPDTIRRFRLGWAPDDRQALRRALSADFPDELLMGAGLLRRPDEGEEPSSYFRNRLMFPIGDRAGRVIAFGGRVLGDGQPKYLNSPDSALFEKGRVLYGWSAARAGSVGKAEAGGPGVIVTEGYMDVIALYRAGFASVVAPLGTALTEVQLQEIWRLAPEPIVCFDGDRPGQQAAIRTLHRALPLLRPGHSLRFARLSPGEDPDSIIRHSGRAAFDQIIAAARPLADLLWESEVGGARRDTPERLAGIQSRLTEHVRAISDRTVRSEFEILFRGRCNPWQARRKNWRESASTTVRDGPESPPRPQRRLVLEHVFSLPLQHPWLIGEVAETFAALEIPEADLDALRRHILEADVGEPGLDARTLRQHLEQNGHAATLQRLVLPFKRSDPEAARKDWYLWARLLTEGEDSVLADISPEDASRLDLVPAKNSSAGVGSWG
jgi:DNA primase